MFSEEIQKEILKHIEYKDMSESLQLISDALGEDIARDMIINLSSCQLYINSIKDYPKAIINYIIEQRRKGIKDDNIKKTLKPFISTRLIIRYFKQSYNPKSN